MTIAEREKFIADLESYRDEMFSFNDPGWAQLTETVRILRVHLAEDTRTE